MPNPYVPRYNDPAIRFNSGWRYPTREEIAALQTPAAHQTRPQARTMSTDYIPQSYPNLQAWLEKQQTELTTTLATNIDMTAQERTDYLAAAAAYLAPVAQIVALMGQLEQLTASLPAIAEAQMPIIRATIKRAKTSPRCTAGIQELLDWVGDSMTFDPNTARPSIEAEAQRGRVKITGKKPGFEAVNIYFRKKGDVQWKLIAVRKRKLPYYDEAPLAIPGTPEVREYMAIGVIDDEEVGQTSEIREVVYAG